MKIFVAVSIVFASSLFAQTPSPSASASAKHPFTFEDMMKLKRLDEPVPSPDGKWVVFSATDVDLEANTKISHLWIVPASGPAAAGRRLNPTQNHEERPRFSPDGKRLIWTSKATDPTQIWMCDFDSGSGALVGKPRQLTTISTGADGGIWSPDGKNIVFVSAVYPDCKDDACNKNGSSAGHQPTGHLGGEVRTADGGEPQPCPQTDHVQPQFGLALRESQRRERVHEIAHAEKEHGDRDYSRHARDQRKQ